MQKIACLNPNEIQQLKNFNSKEKISSVFYYYWINTSNPNEHYSFIDIIELVFVDNSSLFFKLNEGDSGIAIAINFEFEKYKTSLETEFQHKIMLKKLDESESKIWKSAISNPFLEITAISEKGKFLSSTFWIAFKNQKLELNFHPIEGLVVTEWEEIIQ